MKYLDWNELKNTVLMADRGVCFEDVVTAIEDGRVLDMVNHHNQGKYHGQKLLIVEIGDYAYLVPYVEDDEKIFFKTIIPSRKATKQYLRGESL